MCNPFKTIYVNFKNNLSLVHVMNFNKYAVAMFAFSGFAYLMMGTTVGSNSGSSFAQDNLTSPTDTQGSDNLSSTSFSASNFNTTENLSSPLSTSDNNTTVSTTDTNAMKNDSAQNAGGPLDTIKNMFSSLTGGNK
jgi:hypothetical protein